MLFCRAKRQTSVTAVINEDHSRQTDVVTSLSFAYIVFIILYSCGEQEPWLASTRWWLRYVQVNAAVRLSVVCNVRAPYSAGWNFRQCFYAVWYFHGDHPKVTPPSGVNARGAAKYSDFGPIEGYISRKRCRTGGKYISVITNRKSHMSFRLIPNSVTLNGLISPYFTEFGSFRAHYVKVVEHTPILSAAVRALKWGTPLSLAKIWPISAITWKRSKIGGSINH